MVTCATAVRSTCFEEPNAMLGPQDPNTYCNPMELMGQCGLKWGIGTTPTRTWDVIAISVKGVFPKVETPSTINYERMISSLITKKPSYYLKDIYFSWLKVCFPGAINEINKASCLSEEDLNKERSSEEPQFAQHIKYLIDREPVENGFRHPAEKILDEAISDQEDNAILWIESILEQKDPYLVASVIACLGRVAEKSHPVWAIDIVGKALEHSDVGVRDAAAQALESWETPQVLDLLTKHKDKVSWLQEYISKIVTQLNTH